MGLLTRKKSGTPALAGSSSSPTPPPALPSSRSYGGSPSVGKKGSSRYGPSPSLSSLAVEEQARTSQADGLGRPELKIADRFRSTSSYDDSVSFIVRPGDSPSSRPGTPGAESLRGVADPRLVGGSLRGGGGGMGRVEEAALLAAAKKRRMADGDQSSVRSGSSRVDGEHVRGRLTSAMTAGSDVHVVHTRRRRATDASSSPAPSDITATATSTTAPRRPAPRPSLSSSTYATPISIPRPPTPPPPSPERVSFKQSQTHLRPTPSHERARSTPANTRDSVITFSGSTDYRPSSPPPPMPTMAYTSSPPAQSADDSRRAAHELVLRRGNSAYSTTSAGSSSSSPPFSSPIPTMSRSPSLDPLLAPGAPVRRKKWDPNAAFAATPVSSPGPTVHQTIANSGPAQSPPAVAIETTLSTAGQNRGPPTLRPMERPSILTSVRPGAYESMYETDSPLALEEVSPVETLATTSSRVMPPANGVRRPSAITLDSTRADAGAEDRHSYIGRLPAVQRAPASTLEANRPVSDRQDETVALPKPERSPLRSVVATPAPTLGSARDESGPSRAWDQRVNGNESVDRAQRHPQNSSSTFVTETSAVPKPGQERAKVRSEDPLSPDVYFPSISPPTSPPRARPAPLTLSPKGGPSQPSERVEPAIVSRSAPSVKKNVTRTLLHSTSTGKEDTPPKGPNKPTASGSGTIRARSPGRAPSPNGLPRSPRPSPRPSPSSSPRPSTSVDLPDTGSRRLASEPPHPAPPLTLGANSLSYRGPDPAVDMKHAATTQSTPVKAYRPLPQPTPPQTESPQTVATSARQTQTLPPLQTSVSVSGGSVSATAALFEGRSRVSTQLRPTSSTVRRDEMPRRDSGLLPNSPPLTPQTTAKVDHVTLHARPGQSPPPPPPHTNLAHSARSPALNPSPSPATPDPHDSTDGSLDSYAWSASSANSSTTTVSSSLAISSALAISTPTARTSPSLSRAVPPSSFAPVATTPPRTTTYVPPAHEFSPHLAAILATSPVLLEDESRPAYALIHHCGNRVLFEALLAHLSFASWLSVYSTTRAIRRLISLDRDLREVVMERYLAHVGYKKWTADVWGPETLTLTPNDLNAFLRSVSIPAHDFSLRAQAVLSGRDPDPSTVPLLQALTRHYSRVVGRIKLQAAAQVVSVHKARKRSSAFTAPTARRESSGASIRTLAPNKTGVDFSSGLYRLNHALLVRVFVPSAEGPWLSDQSVVKCEDELKSAGVFSVLKPGDCVWNTAINEDGNAGYLLFDGYYLVDLDFQFSVMGEIPSCIDAFKFPPSYWHRVVKAAGNPLLYLDLSGPMGVEIKRNTKLVLDKSPMPAAKGQPHMVQSWIHRSDLLLKEIKGIINADWAGVLVILTQGTKEAVADLGRRLDRPGKTPYRLLRERSRPGEIWIRPVVPSESLHASRQ